MKGKIFAEKHYPDSILPEELDGYLARGWYRMGQTVFTTHFLCFGDMFYSAIWVRQDLEGFQFSKRQRKIMRQNEKHFRFLFRPAIIDREKEKLYQRYKRSFPGLLAPSLKDSLLDGEEFNVFNTYEAAIFQEDRLIAFSFFDLGRDSASSIIGVYDPAYHKYSLGFYTMLLEMSFCQEKGVRYYYPGYVVPGYPRFDYKLRIGPVEYFDLRTETWFPYDSLADEDIPINRMTQKLKELNQALDHRQVPSRLLFYPLFEANLFGFWQAPYFDYPILLHCFPVEGSSRFLLIVFDIREDQFQLLHCSPLDDYQFFFNEAYIRSFDRQKFFVELIVTDHLLKSGTDAGEMVEILAAGRRPGSKT